MSNIIINSYRNIIPQKYRVLIYNAFLKKTLSVIRAIFFFFRTNYYNFISKFFSLKNDKNQAWAFIGKYGYTQYPGVESLKYFSKDIELHIDDKSELPYVIHENKRLYFPKKYKNEALSMYKTLLIEQDNISAHQYVKSDDVFSKKVLLDIGAAEGIISLSNIEKVDFVYLFEYDQDWIDALELTFEPWQNKTKIIKKFVSDNDADNNLSLNTFMKDKPIDNLFIKMDIEGAEMQALNGASYIFENAKDLMFSICTYHNENDQFDIPSFLKKYNYEYQFTNGYLLIDWWLRKGIVHNC